MKTYEVNRGYQRFRGYQQIRAKHMFRKMLCRKRLKWVFVFSLTIIIFVASKLLSSVLSEQVSDVKRNLVHRSNQQEVAPLNNGAISSSLEADPSVRKILVSAYYRSGSTLVGEMTAVMNESFYLFEPYHDLYSAWYGANGYHEVTYLPGGSKRVLPPGEQERLVSTLIDMFECRFDRLPLQFYSNIFFWVINHHTTNEYYKCAFKAKVLFRHWQSCQLLLNDSCPQSIYMSTERALLCHSAMETSSTEEGKKMKMLEPFVRYRQCMQNYTNHMRHCHGILERKCRSARVRSIKTLRLDMETLGTALKRYPNLKIVHLLRDPGAMTYSRMIVNVTEGPKATTCKRLLDDVVVRRRLEQEGYKNNLLELRYEDTVKSFENTADIIYNFAQIEQPKNMKEWIKKRTHSDKDSHVLGTIKKDPLKHVNQYRNSKYTDVIMKYLNKNEDCREVMKLLNYPANL